MTKPYRESDFSHIIYTDRNWRIKEISDLKSATQTADVRLQRVLLRATVTLSYAHWEGHVRAAARLFMQHITLRKLPFSSLRDNFFKNTVLPRLVASGSIGGSVTARYDFIDELLVLQSGSFKRIHEDLINTRSNLNSMVLKDICLVCGVPWDDFESEKDFIDHFLLKRRNAIAHGEETFLSIDDLEQVCDRTIGLMRTFSDALDNIVHLKLYRK